MLNSFPEYIPTHIVSINPKTNDLCVSFVYNTFDLIDKDLDFDEEYYTKIIVNLRRILFNECKMLIETGGKIKRVEIQCNKLVMKNLVHLEHQIIIDNAYSSVVSFTNGPCI